MLRRLSGLLVGLGLLLVPATVQAQSVTVAEARAHGDAIITEAGVEAWFTNITDSDTTQLRHDPSGMICTFPSIGPENRINLYPVVAEGPEPGDDVGCVSWWGSTFITMFATRYPQQYDAEVVMGSAIGDVERAWENVEPYPGDFRVTTFGDQPMPLVYAFSAERNGETAANAIVVRHIGDWSFKTRATAWNEAEEVALAATFVFAISIPGGWEEFLAAQTD